MTDSNSALAQTRMDGILINLATKMGTSADKSERTVVNRAIRMSPRDREELAQDVFLGRICFAYPDAATAKGWEVTLSSKASDPDVLTNFNTYVSTVGGETEDEEMISATEIFSWAGYLANVHQGSAILMNVDDGQPPSEPLRLDRIRTIHSLEVLDSTQIHPDLTTIRNPFKATHYDIVFDRLLGERISKVFSQTKRAGMGYSYKVHRSRILRIPGVRVPPNVMLQNRGWDRSIIEQIWEHFRNWMKTNTNISALLEDYSLFTLSSPGLRETIAEGNEDVLRNRFTALRLMCSLLGGVMIDEDEKLDFVTRSFGGIPEIRDGFLDILVAASDVPHTIILGDSPSGLGATGESEEKTWSKKVGEYQQRVILPRLRRLYRLIWLAQDGPTGGQEPPGWGIKFRPLLEETEGEKIANLSSFIGALSQGINAGFLLPDEARIPFGQQEMSFQVTLDPAAWEAEKEKNNQGFDFAGLGGEEPPPELPPAEGEEPLDAGEATLEEGQTQQDSVRLDVVFTDKELHQQAIAKAKSKFRIYPSAYANGFMTKEYERLYKEKHGTLKGAFRSDDLDEWFNREKWVELGADGSIVGECGGRAGVAGRGKPKCVPRDKANSMSVEDRKRLVQRKRREDPDAERSGKPMMVSSKPKPKKKAR